MLIASHTRRVTDPDRYEPMPGFTELPAWLWRKLGRGAKLALGATALLAAAAIAVLAPQIAETNRTRADDERRERAERRAERIRRLREEVRPRDGRSASIDPIDAAEAPRLAARVALLDDVKGTVRGDARRRLQDGELTGEAQRVTCERYPRTRGGTPPERDLGRATARYSCTAVTAEFRPGAATREGGVIGHPYRVLIDFRTGRFTFCKTTGVTGPERDQAVTVPVACGGRPAA